MDELIEAIAVTAELTGAVLSKAGLKAMAEELAGLPEADVAAALKRCRKELRGRLTLADVLDRVNHGDGRPGAEEAWAIVVRGMDESATVVLNDEMAEACGIARPIYEAGDEVGARMAFREAYGRIVTAAREAKTLLRWWPSLGDNKAGREQVLLEAVRKGLLPAAHVQALLPGIDVSTGQRLPAMTVERLTERQ